MPNKKSARKQTRPKFYLCRLDQYIRSGPNMRCKWEDFLRRSNRKNLFLLRSSIFRPFSRRWLRLRHSSSLPLLKTIVQPAVSAFYFFFFHPLYPSCHVCVVNVDTWRDSARQNKGKRFRCCSNGEGGRSIKGFARSSPVFNIPHFMMTAYFFSIYCTTHTYIGESLQLPQYSLDKLAPKYVN